MGDVWDEDYDLEGGLAPVVDSVPFKPPRRERKLKGNTKMVDAQQARAATMRDAQGIGEVPVASDWREQLAAGDKGKAISSLTDGGLTHNAGSGFGLAQRNWWDT